ncbi:MAG: hypothetical protein K0S39_2238 [Paenibacillus sp.]|nr:hypothetical protein [Paenibacillus sp.]
MKETDILVDGFDILEFIKGLTEASVWRAK